MLSAFVCFFSLFVYIFALFFIYLGTIYIINKALFNAVLTRSFSTSSEVHKHDYMYPVHMSLMSISSQTFCVAYWMVQKFGLPQIQALSEAMSAELATIGISCALSSHVLSAGR